MRRLSSGLVGLSLIGAMGLFAPAQAATPAPTEFHVGIVVGEGPAPASGSTFDYAATLVDAAQAPVAGAQVELMIRPYGATTYRAAAHAVTDSDGNASVRVVLTKTTSVRWSWAGDADHAGSTSPGYTEPVGSRVRAHAQDSTLVGTQKVVVLGTTTPIKPGTRVSLWVGDKPAFVPGQHRTRIAVGTIARNGTFRLVARFAHPGAKRLYVKVNAGGGTTDGYSRYLNIRVR